MADKGLYTTLKAEDIEVVANWRYASFVDQYKTKGWDITQKEAYYRGFADCLHFIEQYADKFEIR